MTNSEDTAQDPELARYIQYLQKSLLATDESVLLRLDPARAHSWIERSRAQLESIVATYPSQGVSSLVSSLEQRAKAFAPASELDSFWSAEINREVLANVLAAARAVGFAPMREVIVANSPSPSPTPLARPSSAEHVLFAGAGTFAFCNYWGKVFAAALTKLSLAVAPRRLGDVAIDPLFRQHPELLVVPTQLSLYFALTGTVIGFGQVAQNAELFGHRMELLRAMEVFSIGHEFGHFVQEERRQTASEAHSIVEEQTADALGFLICRQFGVTDENWSAYTGTAPLLFFHAIELCEEARSIATGVPWFSDTHPPTAQRLSAIRDLVAAHPHEDERAVVVSYVEECDALAIALRVAVTRVLRDVLANAPQSGDARGVC